MGKTADAIAAGDLTRRVETANDRTEVGRLGLALNAMLAEIEGSTSACAASSPTRRTSCARRSPPSAPTPSCSRAAPTGAPTTWRARWPGSGASRERMSLLVEDLLLLARLDEGRPLERRRVRLDEVAAEAVDDGARRGARSGRSRSTPSPAVVLGDRDRLRQVFDNLLANVRAHTPAGSAASVRVGQRERQRRDRGRRLRAGSHT